jgi:hypothetical protein
MLPKAECAHALTGLPLHRASQARKPLRRDRHGALKSPALFAHAVVAETKFCRIPIISPKSRKAHVMGRPSLVDGFKTPGTARANQRLFTAYTYMLLQPPFFSIISGQFGHFHASAL